MPALTLRVAQYVSPADWYWRLHSPAGAVLADHHVELDPPDWHNEAIVDLFHYCEDHCHPDTYREDQQRIVNDVGAWLGKRGLGSIGARILAEGTPSVVRVVIPTAAEQLLYLPWELAHVNGKPLSLSDVSFVFEVENEQPPVVEKPIGEALRVLAVFSLPHGAGALNLRQERYRLARLFKRIATTRQPGRHPG
jgi:hypothetical protein